MPIEREGELYYNASEAATYLRISRPTFHNNVAPKVQKYEIGGLKRSYYRKQDLDRFKGVRQKKEDY